MTAYCSYFSKHFKFKLIKFCFQRVLSHQDDTALLKAYIVEWRKFFTQCDILPKPFCQLEVTLLGKQSSNKKSNMEDSIVRKVCVSPCCFLMSPNALNIFRKKAFILIYVGFAIHMQTLYSWFVFHESFLCTHKFKLQLYLCMPSYTICFQT